MFMEVTTKCWACAKNVESRKAYVILVYVIMLFWFMLLCYFVLPNLKHYSDIYLVVLRATTKNVINWPVSASRFELGTGGIRSKMLAAGEQ